MTNYNLVRLSPILEEDFNSIYDVLKMDETVNKYVSFHKSNADGIFYLGQLVGLFSLSRFIDNNLSISIAILQQFRGKGIGKIASQKIVEEYGKGYIDAKLFIANVKSDNDISNKSYQNSDWNQTHEYDEMMMEEGADFYNIYYKENPYYEKKEVLGNKR